MTAACVRNVPDFAAARLRRGHRHQREQRVDGRSRVEAAFAFDPLILIKFLRGVVRNRQRHARAVAERELGLREVNQDLTRRPLPRGVAALEVARRPSVREQLSRRGGGVPTRERERGSVNRERALMFSAII
jgi:hypothetical protein